MTGCVFKQLLQCPNQWARTKSCLSHLQHPNSLVNEELTIESEPILEFTFQTTLSDYVSAIAWSPIGNTLVAASSSGEVYLLKSLVGLSLCPPTGKSIDTLAFSFDGKWLAAGGLDGNITLWRMDGDEPEIADTLESGSWIDKLVWSPTCNHLAFNLGKTVQIWEADQSELVTELFGASTPHDLAWSPDGKHLAIAIKNDVKIWNTQNWRNCLYQWELNSPANSISWSPDGSYLACAIYDRSICVLDWSKVKYLQAEPTDEANLPTRMSGFPGKIHKLAWANLPPSANFPPLLAASTREIVTLWIKNPEDWDSWVLELSSGNVLDVAFQPKSGVLASLAEDGWIVLWQAAVEAEQVLDGAEEGFSCLAWHPTGCRLAAGGVKGELFVWSVC